MQKTVHVKVNICSGEEEGRRSVSLSREEEEGGGGGGGGRETSGGIWARERGNTAHIPGELIEIRIKGDLSKGMVFFTPETI